MGNLWLKFRIWTKVIALFFLTIYAIFFIWNNGDQPAKVWLWFFSPAYETNLLWVMLVAFLIGVLGTILLRTMFKTLRQIRELRERTRTETLEREMAEMKTKAAKLQARPDPPAEGMSVE